MPDLSPSSSSRSSGSARRRLFLGDIQGCHDELCRLLDALQFEPAADRLYSVGDIINRGPDSAGCIRTLREYGAVAVLGNHELHYFETLAGRRKPSARDTLDQLLEAPDRDELTAWLRDQPLLHCEADLILVHAALHPSWNNPEEVGARLQKQVRECLNQGIEPRSEGLRFAVSARYCDAEGQRPPKDWPVPGAPFRPWHEFYTGERLVVFGHWARGGLQVAGRVRGLDTGCVYGRKLTAWIAEEDRIVQVDARRAYSPL